MSWLHFLAALACLGGAILQFAVHRAPEVVDTRRSVTIARRLTVAALLVAFLYIMDGHAPKVASLILGLFGLAQMLYAAHNLKLDIKNGTHA